MEQTTRFSVSIKVCEICLDRKCANFLEKSFMVLFFKITILTIFYFYFLRIKII